MSVRALDTVTAVLSIAGAAVTPIITYAIPTGAGIFGSVRAHGRITAGGTVGNSVYFHTEFGAKNPGGTVSLTGAVDPISTDNDTGLNGATLTFTVSGGNVIVNVQGAAGLTVEWFVVLDAVVN